MTDEIITLLERGTVLLDGGFGSALFARGLEGGGATSLWNVEAPDTVREIHAGYLAAGSDVVQANSFDASGPSLARHGLEERMVELNLAAARLAREAVEQAGGGLVAGDIGPTGLFRPPLGTASKEDFEAAFEAQARALVEGGVDYFALETFSDMEEARLAVKAIRKVCLLPITACLTFDRKKRGFFTMMGDTLTDAVNVFAGEGVAAVGANCSIGSDVMVEATSTMLEAAQVPVIVKPNAGLPRLEGTRAVYDQAPADFARDVQKMVELGARVVGGCCGSDDRFIAAIRTLLGPRGTS